MTAESVSIAPKGLSAHTRSFWGGVVSTLLVCGAVAALQQVITTQMNKPTIEKWVQTMNLMKLGFKPDYFWGAQQALVAESGQARVQDCIIVHDFWTKAQEQWKTDGEQGTISGIKDLSVRLKSDSSNVVRLSERLGVDIDPATVFVDYYPSAIRYEWVISNLWGEFVDLCPGVKGW